MHSLRRMGDQLALVMRQLPLSFVSVCLSIDSEVQATTLHSYQVCEKLGQCPKMLAGKYQRAAASVEKKMAFQFRKWGTSLSEGWREIKPNAFFGIKYQVTSRTYK